MFDARLLHLMAITDDLRDGAEGLVARSRAAVRGGATCVQLRLKQEDARTLVAVARMLVAALPVPVIVNDRVDVALAAGAAGAHLGAEDIPAAAARAFVPHGFVLGVSVGCDAEAPNAAAADYVGIGPVFATSSKSDAGAAIGATEFARLARLAARPAIAIGGITAENAPALRGAGAAGVAVIRAVMGAANPEAAARQLSSAIGR